MKKLIVSKKAFTKELRYGIFLILFLLIGFLLLRGLSDNVKSSGTIIISVAKSFLSSQKPSEIDLTQIVDESIVGNVYSAIYIFGNKDSKSLPFKDHLISYGLVKQFTDIDNVESGADSGEEFPDSLSNYGCYIVALEDDVKSVGDNVANLIYKPYKLDSYILKQGNNLGSNSWCANLGLPIKDVWHKLEEDCNDNYDCHHDGFLILYQFLCYDNSQINSPTPTPFFQTQFFNGKDNILCINPSDKYVWAKCGDTDYEISGYHNHNEITYECKDGKWSEIID